MVAFLPQHDGLLPLWLLLISLVSILNSAQAYSTLKYTQRVYSASPASVTALSARTFGTWTFLSSVIRLYAAYNISEPAFYQLAICTFVLAFLHFMSEWNIFKTAAWGAGLAGPVFVASGSLVWMLTQWGYYVQ
ncbi:MAG: ergosterol biosynthesis protein [Piccolia ochrophora]|nr:MAG: ergosterol biosynthesis protein [Piccolia ochrophora]